MEQFTFNKRLLSETLARYSDTFVAFCELLNNSIQAKATEIDIQVDYTPTDKLAGSDVERIIIHDNGVGVQQSEFQWKILQIATQSKTDGKGIGRFAPLQMAASLTIETVAFNQFSKQWVKSELRLRTSEWNEESLDKVPIHPIFTPLEGEQKSYYRVTIEDFCGPEVTTKEKHRRISRNFQESQIGPALFAAYPEQLFKQSVVIRVNGKPVNPNDFIVGPVEKREETFTSLDGKSYRMDFQFIQLRPSGKHRIFLRVGNDSIKTVAYTFDYSVEIPEPNQWFVLVDSPYFDENSNTYRNLDLLGLDPHAEHLTAEIKHHSDNFFAAKYQHYQDFIKKLYSDSFYPYKNHEPSSKTRSAVFNQLAFYVEEKHHLLSGKHSIRELVYALLDKAMDNRQFELLLSEAIKLDDESLKRFTSLLDRADLEDVIAFSEEVCRKQQILDFLHKLNYAEISKRVKERSELHKIVEKHLWIFGEQYSGSPRLFSDKNLENNLFILRSEYLLFEESPRDNNVNTIEDEKVKNVTDLFFFNETIVSDEEREVLIVELKAPKVRISDKELGQAKRYALQIEEQGVFPKGHRYKVILVGSALNSVAKASCGTIDPRNPYLYYTSKNYNIEAWAVEWSELIARNKKKLSYLGNALHTKDEDATAIIEKEFKDVKLNRLKSEMATQKPKKAKKKNAA